MPVKAKHKIDIKTGKDGGIDEILIWFGEQCIFHFQRIADERIGIDLYLTPHQHIDLISAAAITAQKDGQSKTLRKATRHANMLSDREHSGDIHAAEPTSEPGK